MWLRFYNFFEEFWLHGVFLGRQVEYRCQLQNTIVKSIAVIEDENKNTFIQMNASTPHFYKILVAHSAEIYKQKPSDLQEFIKQVKLPVRSSDDINTCIVFLEKLNSEYQIKIFNEEFIEELRLIHEFITHRDENKIYRHNIHYDDERARTSEYYHQRVKQNGTVSDTQLDDEFFWPENFSTKKLKKYLASGESPNVLDWGGRSAFYHVIGMNNRKATELMLLYGANPFFRDHMFYTTPFEHAISLDFRDAIEPIISFCTKFDYPIISMREWFEALIQAKNQAANNFKKPIQILQILMYSVGNNYTIEYNFENNTQIANIVKSCDLLTAGEKSGLFDAFKQEFYPYNESKSINDIFQEEIFNENTYIDLIYDKKKLIAFNHFQIFTLPEHKNTIILNCNLAEMNPNYRGTRLMSLLTLRVGFALQQLYPEKEIAVYFTMLDKMGYRLIQSLVHWPMYQDEYSERLLTDIVDHLYKEKSGYYHKNAKCYIYDDLKVSEAPKTNSSNDIHDKHYYSWRLGYKKEQQLTNRALPVLLFVDEENFKRSKVIIEKIGVKFEEHINEYKNHLAALLGVKIDNTTKFSLPKGNTFFSRSKNELTYRRFEIHDAEQITPGNK